MECYNQFANHIEKNEINVPVFFESSDKFLQFLFDLNIICYIEDTEDSQPHIHWSFRERTYSNINPKVKEGGTLFNSLRSSESIQYREKI